MWPWSQRFDLTSAAALLPRRALQVAGVAALGALAAEAVGMPAPAPAVVGLAAAPWAFAATHRRGLWATAIALAAALVLAPNEALLVAAGASGAAIAMPSSTDRWDPVIGGLLLFVAVGLFPVPPAWRWGEYGSMIGAISMVIVTPAPLLATAWRHDHPRCPGAADVQDLHDPHQRRAVAAITALRASLPLAADVRTRRGLAEITHGVVRLERTLQALRREAARLQDSGLLTRAPAEPDAADDPVTVAHRRAADAHLDTVRRTLQTIERECAHLEALLAQSTTLLEAARATLTLSRLRDEVVPVPEMGDVLHRLRSFHAHQEARAAARRELSANLT